MKNVSSFKQPENFDQGVSEMGVNKDEVCNPVVLYPYYIHPRFVSYLILIYVSDFNICSQKLSCSFWIAGFCEK